MTERDEFFMRRALSLAAKAAELGEVPVGAVIVKGDEIIVTELLMRDQNLVVCEADCAIALTFEKLLDLFRGLLAV